MKKRMVCCILFVGLLLCSNGQSIENIGEGKLEICEEKQIHKEDRTPPQEAVSPVDVTTETGVFVYQNVRYTYTIMYPTNESDRNGDLWILPLVAHSPHMDTSQKDDKKVESCADFAREGFIIAAVDYGDAPYPYDRGYRADEEAKLMIEFAKRVKKWSRETLNFPINNTFISGGSHSGWITLLALELGGDIFDGGISNCGVTHLRGQELFGRYNLIFSLGTSYYGAANNYLVNIVHSAVALRGPPVDRNTWKVNRNYKLISPALRTNRLTSKTIIIQGDSDIVVPPFSLWEFVDPLTERGSKDFIGFSVPAEGHGASGRGHEFYYGDLHKELVNWVRGNPIRYEPGVTYGSRDNLDWIPSPSDIWNVSLLPPPSNNDFLKLKEVKGYGSNIGRFSNKIICEDVDKDGKVELIYGTLDGFIEVLEWSNNEFVEEWRSEDFGTGTVAVDVGDLDNDGELEIVASDDRGTLRVFEGKYPFNLIAHRHDKLEYPIWDVFVEDLDGIQGDELIVRSIDGYLYVYEGTHFEQRWRRWIGPAIGSGMTVADTDNDGVKDVIVGNLSGYLIVVDGRNFSYKWVSNYLSAYPLRIAVANVQGGSTKEIFVECSEHGNQDDARETLVFHGGTYSELMNFKSDGNTFGFDAQDIDNDGFDEIAIGSYGFVRFIDTPNKPIMWRSAVDDTYFSGVAIEDLDSDMNYEIIATSAEGSIYVFDTSLNPKWKFHGYAAPFGIAVSDVLSGDKDEIIVGTRTGQLRYLNENMDVLKELNLDKLWPHAVEVDDVDNDNKLEVVIGTGHSARGKAVPGEHKGYLIVLDAETGKKEWSTPVENGPFWGLAVDDVDNDGVKEIVAANRVTVVLGNDEYLARVYIYGYDKSTRDYKVEAEYEVEGHDLYVDVGDCDLDGEKEIVVGDRRGYLTILKGDMKGMHRFDDPDVDEVREWLSGNLGTRVHGVKVIPRKGEIVVGNEEGFLKLISFNRRNKSYEVKWESKDLGSHLWGILVDNIDGEGGLEVVTGNGNGTLFVFDLDSRSLVYRYDGLGSFVGIYGSIEFGDVDGDGRNELVVGSSGYLYLFDVGKTSIACRKQREGDLYIVNKEITPTFGITLILGDITIGVNAAGAEFYVNDELRYIDKNLPFVRRLDERRLFKKQQGVTTLETQLRKGGLQRLILFFSTKTR
jgi:WD40 repeat protein